MAAKSKPSGPGTPLFKRRGPKKLGRNATKVLRTMQKSIKAKAEEDKNGSTNIWWTFF